VSFLDEPLLLIPIHVDALAVGNKGWLPPGSMFQWTNLTPNFLKLANDYQFASQLIGDPGGTGSPFDAAIGLETGIHLHFRLPRAFSHGIQQGENALSFPAIPNRWLVQRLGGDPATYTAWLIKSDARTNESSATPWPKFPDDEQTPAQFNLIGTYSKLTASLPQEDEPASVNLTAMGQGNPLFSAHYPACRSVLGFYDPLTKVSSGARLSYLITGWFSSAADDPLHTAEWQRGTITPQAERDFRAKNKIPEGTPLTPDQWAKLLWDAWLRERQWTCDLDGSADAPSRLLCHGLVRGITWHGGDWNYMQPSDQGASLSQPEVFPRNEENHEKAYQVAVGNTGGEALAALLADGNVDQDLLAALHEGLLGQPVTAADLQYELHSRRFDGIQGGTTFAIQPEPDYSEVKDAHALNQSSRGQSTILPGPLSDLLQQLNEKQRKYDRLARKFADSRWQVYALWHLWTGERKRGEDPARIKKLKSQLDTFKDVLDKKRVELDRARAARDELFTAKPAPEPSTGKIIEELAKYPRTQPDGSPRFNAGNPELRYRLVVSTARPFYGPGEPVIAVAGPATARLNTADPSSRALVCRLSRQLVKGILLQVPGGKNVTVQGETILDDLFPREPALQLIGAAHRSLLAEALLLDGRQASNIAGHASQQHRDALTKIVEALQDPESTEAQKNPPPPPNALLGRLPDRIAIFNWPRNPWIPLLLAWEVSWQSDYEAPAGQPLPEDLVNGRWRLDRMSGDLVRDREPSAVNKATYQGYSILTQSASRSLAKSLEELNPSHPLIDKLKNQNAQLQRLAGFHDALIRQQAGMQIPPLDYGRWSERTDTSIYFVDQIRAFLKEDFARSGGRNNFRTEPDTTGSPFLPIRSGRLQIAKLSIVDVFGQTLLLPVARINESASTRPSMLHRAHNCLDGEPPTVGSVIPFKPRFVQPTRLQLQSVNAARNVSGNGGPVCGWIVPNYLEKSLTIYDSNGQPLGALQKKLGQTSGSGDKAAFFWVDVPGAHNGDAASTNVAERLPKIIKNTHLFYFCSWVLSLNPDIGATFYSVLNEAIASTDQRVPDEDPGVSVLVGRPLVLMRASFQLEIAGLPAHQLELRADTGTNVRDLIETNGFEKVKWPLRLGNLGARNDGLIGLFKCSGDDVTTGPFYASWGRDRELFQDDVKVFAAQDFSIDCVQPLAVTMLMDPQARVHATTGVLPRGFFELPHETQAGAKRAREVVFQTAPVLGFTPTPAMPRPSDDYGEWSWAYRPDVTQWKLDPNLVEATDRGGFNGAWPTIAEGWLKLAIAPVKVLSFWLREPTETVTAGARVHLAWSLQGAESLELVKVKEHGKTIEPVEGWDAQPFPNEYGVIVDAKTTYRLIARAEGGKSDTKDLTINIAAAG